VNKAVPQPIPAPLGLVEPHELLLHAPPEGQLLYKIMTMENLLRSIEGGYLHFNRVDSYTDLSNGDLHDGQQLPGDRAGNKMSRFAKAPDFSGADYYDQCRGRTYACCFSLENSDYIWSRYGNVGVVFDFSKLRAAINRVLQPGNAALFYNGIRCHQIFSVNYGIIEYVDWDRHQANEARLPNPIVYTYRKDRKQFSEEKELRISLSAIGMGYYVLDDRSVMDFPISLQLPFDFRSGVADGTIQQILYEPDCDLGHLRAGLRALGAETVEGSVPSSASAPSRP
jgi:hypothetical protein